MFVLPKELFIRELRVEVPFDNFDSLEACSHLLVDPWPSAPVSVDSLTGHSTLATRWRVWLWAGSNMAQQ